MSTTGAGQHRAPRRRRFRWRFRLPRWSGWTRFRGWARDLTERFLDPEYGQPPVTPAVTGDCFSPGVWLPVPAPVEGKRWPAAWEPVRPGSCPAHVERVLSGWPSAETSTDLHPVSGLHIPRWKDV